MILILKILNIKLWSITVVFYEILIFYYMQEQTLKSNTYVMRAASTPSKK